MSLPPTDQLLKALWKKDPAVWLELYGRIKATDPTKEKLVLNYLQRKILAVWRRCEELGIPCRIIALKPRQKGCSTISGGLCYWLQRARKVSTCIIGGEYSQTENLWNNIVKHFHQNDPCDWGNTGTINARVARWSHGSEMAPETANDPNAGRSGTYQFLLVTELGRWAEKGVANASEVLAGILKCVKPFPGTTVIMESTAGGASGEFYERYQDALPAERFLAGEMPEPGGYISVFAPWFEFYDSAIRLTPAQKDEIQRTLDAEPWYKGEADLIRRLAHNNIRGRPQLGDTDHGFDLWEQLAWRRYAIRQDCKRDLDEFNQDYPESPEVAFMRSGRVFFNQFGLSRLRDLITAKTPAEGMLEIQPGATTPMWRPVATSLEANFQMWERPTPNRRYLISVDPATGKIEPGSKDPDCHAVLVLRQGYHDPGAGWVRPAVVARIRPPCRWEISLLAEQVWLLARFYGGPAGCLIVPEVNMDRGLIELLKLKNAQIAHRTVMNKDERRLTADLGAETTGVSRGLWLDGLATAVREYDRDGDGIDVWCPHLIDQMGTFVIKDSGRAEHESGKHDDDVLSLAIGLAHLASATILTEQAFVRAIPPDILAQRATHQSRYGGNGAAGLS